MKKQSMFGYFEHDSNEPKYNPPLDIECPFCGKQLSKPINCTSFTNTYSNNRSYFYRYHKGCYDEEKAVNIESLIIDFEETK